MTPYFRTLALVCILAGTSCEDTRQQKSDTKDPPMPSTTLSDYESAATKEVFRIDGGDVPWGDYGSILVHGMTAHLGREKSANGRLQLERTGPFVPPITFPGIGDIVVTDDMKQAMEKAGFQGISFHPVLKVHFVEVPWHTWDLKAEDPEYYPEEGEPEGYILDREHSPEVADAVGDLWEVVYEREGGGDFYGYMNVSNRAKSWFEASYPRWTSFRVVTKP
jgi:hypothetical protein